MSDYLWDKTGEPEEDVAQLEHVLGVLKYQPRPLDIPASAMPTATAAATTTTAATRTHPAGAAVIFSRPRLALAASLLLTLLAGMWLMTRQGEPQTNPLASAGRVSAPAGNGPTATPALPNDAAHRNALADNVELPKPREDKAVAVAPVPAGARRPMRQPVAKRQKHLHPRAAEHAPREEVALVNGTTRWQVEQPLTPRQREATEQLMLALRLASAKLNYAQREMQEIGRAGK